MQAANMRDEPTRSLHEYLNTNLHKNIIALTAVVMFAIVFYLIYLLVEFFSDKEKHYKLALQSFERYEARKRAQLERNRQLMIEKKNRNLDEEDLQTEKTPSFLDDQKLRNKKLNYTIWTNRNLQISFIHSVLCSIWLILILIFRSCDMFADLVQYISWDTYLVVAFSSGYFLYDFYDILANGYLKSEWVVCLHHWIVIVSFSYHMINLFNISYTVVALFMEFNSVFLHARKLLKFYQFTLSHPKLVLVNNILNLVSFVLFRFGILIFIMISMKYDGPRVPGVYLILLMIGTFAMTVINVILFKRILVRDWLSMCKMKRNQQKKTQNNDIENKQEIVESETLLLEKNKCDLSNTNGNCNKLAIQIDNSNCKNTHQNNNMVIKKFE
jgi:hypothetical protein